MTVDQQITHIFSHFHDGTLTAWKGDYKKLMLTIDLEYLAQQIAPGFEHFYVELDDIDTLRCEPWGEEPVSYETLFSDEIKINTADEKDGYAVITYFSNDFPTTGGFIYIKAGGVKLYQHERKEITAEDLTEASKRYWNNFAK